MIFTKQSNAPQSNYLQTTQTVSFQVMIFETLRETVVTEVCSLQQWINANKLTINYDPKISRFSVFKPLTRELADTYKDDLFIHDNLLKYKEHTNYLYINYKSRESYPQYL